MPKTKFQELVFSLIMVFVMVYTMTVYNDALEGGLTYSSFSTAFLSMWAEFIAAFLAQRYIAGPMVNKILGKLFQPGVDRPIIITIARAGCTAMYMAPMMTLFVTLFHSGINGNFLVHWLPRLVLNFPFALCMQIFYIGPLVRFVFRTIFSQQVALAPQRVEAAE